MMVTGEATSKMSLVIGGAATGKSTFLVQLYGRMQNPESSLRVIEAPVSLEPIRDGLARLSRGLSVRHTPSASETIQLLHVEDSTGNVTRLAIPDYSGESLDSIVDDRRLPERWRRLIADAVDWKLFVRIEVMEDLPRFAEIGAAAVILAGEPAQLPLDMRLVELLQIVRHERQRHTGDPSPPYLTVVLSCWDEITDCEPSHYALGDSC